MEIIDQLAEKITLDELRQNDTEILNRITTEYLLQHKEPTLKWAITLIDVATVIDVSYAMHTLVNLLTYVYPLKFTIEEFSPFFFSSDDGCTKRRKLLTNNFRLQGKVKPGSRLLLLYRNLVTHIPQWLPDNLKIIANWKDFIISSFEITDKLLQTHDWHMFPSLYRGAESKFSQSARKSAFLDYISLQSRLFDANLIASINDATVQPQLYGISKIIDISTKGKVVKWSLDEDAFIQQIRTKSGYWSLRLQLLILDGELGMKEYSKAKLPTLPPIQSNNKVDAHLKKAWSVLKTRKFNEKCIRSIFNQERTWTKMKVKQFTHPKMDQPLRESKISKEMKKRPKFVHRLGTPTLSRLWRVDHTNLSSLSESILPSSYALSHSDFYIAKENAFNFLNE
ncbi:hypothetical protein CAS74_001547 [Pichia kudriavzevii]|uniref:Uncharacterized protein n=1 Tax=Pichia kudriavzevii TaxID=4909 RepID=A0A1Z8JS40_PICKU|nr:hypothetical protein CAS74_001547 [Pichia kudriavzevii]